ncbi:MAG: hypothetical protein EPO11_05785 [Gammaproteobacteria bacterium]|nr:MAG: hypothetical protein EPO11_05785 [Gammaproteobacteria bacterium]
MTKKQFAAKRTLPAARRAVGQARWRWLLSIGVLAAAFFCAIFLVSYVSKHAPSSRLSTYVSRMTTWIAERRHRSTNTAKSASIANKEEAEQPIHFEFYNTLPAMQVKTTVVATEAAAAPASASIVNAGELEKELASHIKKKRK